LNFSKVQAQKACDKRLFYKNVFIYHFKLNNLVVRDSLQGLLPWKKKEKEKKKRK